MLNEQKRTICVFKCWLNCQLASVEALPVTQKEPSTIQRRRGARSLFCVQSCKNDIRRNWVPSMLSRITSDKHVPIKNLGWVVTELCIFGGSKKRPRRTSLNTAFNRRLPPAASTGNYHTRQTRTTDSRCQYCLFSFVSFLSVLAVFVCCTFT